MHTDNENEKVVLPASSSDTERSRVQRIEFLQKSKNLQLESYENSDLPVSTVKSNIESFIGTMSIPVGLAGPLLFNNEMNGTSEQVFCPVATTEGALVASMNRGAKAIGLSGGFSAHVSKQRMLRAPMYCFENINQSVIFQKWIEKNVSLISVFIKQYSQRAELLEIKPTVLGRNIELKFYYSTADAAGQNMTTICTWHACLWIEKEFNKAHDFKIDDFVLDGNGSSDKKASYDAITNGRGTDVVGECVIDEEILKSKLKITSREILSFYQKSRPIITANGMVGDNVNIANTIAAIFTACGQDIACVHESAVGYLNFEPHERGLYMSLRLPKLVIGTVGGGTKLPSQKDNLEIMDCYGPGKVERLAKLICGFAMSLELSTISAMVSGQFAIAHEKLGRNKPVNFLKQNNNLTSFINENLFSNTEGELSFDKNLTDSNGIITDITSQSASKFIGLSIWDNLSNNEQRKVLIKSKPTAKETLNCMYILTGMLAPKLAKYFKANQADSDFEYSDQKEVLICSELQKSKSENYPEIYGVYSESEREISLIAMEFINSEKSEIFNAEMKPELWSLEIVESLFETHLTNLKQLESLKSNSIFKAKENLLNSFNVKTLNALKDEYGNVLDKFYKMFERAIERTQRTPSNSDYKTIVHNDFNPRNIAVSSNKSYIYDWELARVNFPQRDLVEFLCFTMTNSDIETSLFELVENYRVKFNRIFNNNISQEDWLTGLLYSLDDFVLNRLNLYLLGNKLTRYEFVDFVAENALNLEQRILTWLDS